MDTIHSVHSRDGGWIGNRTGDINVDREEITYRSGIMGSRFVDAVEVELARAKSKHPTKQVNAHEGYAVLLEEVDEVWELVKTQKPKEHAEEFIKELVHVGAMAQRMAEEVFGA